MNILVTAGNTQTVIDQVRCITNIFTGRTGSQIAAEALNRGHTVTLLTSHPEIVDAIPSVRQRILPYWQVHKYRTFEDLQDLMAKQIISTQFDVIIHSAAVSDYYVTGVYAPQAGTYFNTSDQTWKTESGIPSMKDISAGKVKSHHHEIWLRLQPAPKLVDQIRRDWGYTGILVKFKLEVGLSETELLDVAERSRQQSDANWMVANTLEGRYGWAYIGSSVTGYERVERSELAARLLEKIERDK